MLDRFNNLKIIDKVLIISGTSVILLFFGYIIFTKRPTLIYHIPEDFSGWVTIKYEKGQAPPLKETDEGLQITIPPSGVAETSSRLQSGWGKELYYRYNENQATPMDRVILKDNEAYTYIHDKQESHMRFDSVYFMLAPYTDTVLWEGTSIEREDTSVEVRTGRKVIEYFYVSPEPLKVGYLPAKIPQDRLFW